jgi:hypothetical protein
MTACPHCQRTLPSDLSGTTCPACKKSLPLVVVRSANPAFTETPALGQARPAARPAQPTPAEDRWDDVPAAVSDPIVPTSVGLPGARASSRRGGATRVMGSDDAFASDARDADPPASSARPMGERRTDDLVSHAVSTAERAVERRPTAAGVPGTTARPRGNATIVGASPLAAPAPDRDANSAVTEGAAADSDEETKALLAAPSTIYESAPSYESDDDQTTALRSESRPAQLPREPGQDRSTQRPATTADAPIAATASSATAATPSGSSIATKSAGASATGKNAIASSPSAAASGPRPVLASDILREDLVPHEPARQALRVVLGIAGVVLIALTAISLRDPAQAIAWAIPGLTSIIVVIAPSSYGTRALLPFAPASAALLMQAIAVPGTRIAAAVVFTMTAGGLPAALLYRSFFRASRRARAFVAVGLLAAAIWLQLPGGGAIFENGQGAWAMGHIPALALIGVSLLSLLAFVGADTTAGCRAWATLAIAWAGFAALAQRTVLAGADLDRDAWVAALATTALSAVTALTGAALLALYSRPSAPRTGIGAAASQH